MEINIESAIRLCPVSLDDENLCCIQSNSLSNTIQVANNQTYPVNHALPLNCCQNTVFSSVVVPLINYLLEGCDVSVVTCGQAGTGKTYTLYGPGFHYAASEAEQGVVPRFIREVFTKLKQFRDRTWSVHITWSQICGDTVQDLLGGGSIECEDILDAFQLIQLGLSNVAPKYAHTLFTMTLEQQWIIDASVQHRISTASFADLASCEKMLIYNNSGLVQTVPTDPGLQALQSCITTLSDPCYRLIDVPYSQSVLTTLLRDSFGGRAKTVFLCCMSPLAGDFHDSLYTLQLATRAQMIKNLVTVNSYTTYETAPDQSDVFGLQFAANQLLKLVSNAEELFQRLVGSGCLKQSEVDQISQWLLLKQECDECLSEDSEPHRSLERIEEEDTENCSDDSSADTEEASTEEEENQSFSETKLDQLIDQFQTSTDILVTKINLKGTNTESVAQDSLNSSASNNIHTYRRSGARGRRNSVHTIEEAQQKLSSLIGEIQKKLSNIELDDDAMRETKLEMEKEGLDSSMNYELKKKLLKQVNVAIHGYQKQVSDLEHTIKMKENHKQQLLKHKNTTSHAHTKIDLKCQKIKKEVDTLQVKISLAQANKNHTLETKYKSELNELVSKLQDAENLKYITEDKRKIMELESSLHTSKQLLKKLKERKKREEKQKQKLESEIKEERKKMNRSKDSSNSIDNKNKKSQDDSKALVFLARSNTSGQSSVSLSNDELEAFRHEIRNLRKTRDYLLEQRCKIDTKSQNKKILNDIEERKLIQYEEAIEAIDLAIEYKNEILSGHRSIEDKTPEKVDEKGDVLMMDRLMQLSENEMRMLLYKYFQKVIDLRTSSKKLEVQVIDYENKNEALIGRVQNLSHTLQQVRSESERQTIIMQQQHQDQFHMVWRYLANGNSGDDWNRMIKVLGPIVGPGTSSSKPAKRTILDKIRQEVGPKQLQTVALSPQAKLTKKKNMLFIKQSNK